MGWLKALLASSEMSRLQAEQLKAENNKFRKALWLRANPSSNEENYNKMIAEEQALQNAQVQEQLDSLAREVKYWKDLATGLSSKEDTPVRVGDYLEISDNTKNILH